MSASRQYCSFTVNGELFGVEISKVMEIGASRKLTRIPLAPMAISGLINLRGQVLTAIDLRQRLGFGKTSDTAKAMNVVIRTNDGLASLLVDEIGDVITVDAEGFEPPPGTLAEAARDMIMGTYQLDEQLLMVLDAEQVVNLGIGAGSQIKEIHCKKT